MLKMVPVSVEQSGNTIIGYDEAVGRLIGEVMQMSEKEFDLFLDCIEVKRNKKLTKFCIWLCNNRKRIVS